MAPISLHPYVLHPGPNGIPVRVAALPQLRTTPWHGLLLPLLLTLALLALVGATTQAQVAISSTGAAPTANAMLDIITNNSLRQGLLAPRMTRSQRIAIAAPIPDGLLVYQTDDATSDVKGYYYYDSQTAITGWRHIADGGPIWLLGGNAGTTSADFIGTLNARPLIFRTHDQERGRITDDGKFQLYFTTPPVSSELVHVEGGIKLNGGSVTPDQEGTIRYVPGAGTGPGRFEGYVSDAANVGSAVAGWKQIDNNFGERKNQETADASAGCEDPTNINTVAGAVTANPRPWPIPGPAGPYSNLSGPSSPYYSLWEDSRRQYLYLANDLAAAGICSGIDNPIRAIAFNVTGGSLARSGRLHFLRFRMKNTAAVAITGFDNNLLPQHEFARPAGPEIPPGGGQDWRYNANHLTGYTVVNGWNVHVFNDGVNPPSPGTGFIWSGGNLLIDAAVDNQEWISPSLQEGNVQGYNSGYSSLIRMHCDACGGTGAGTCIWNNGVAPPFYFPPTTPTNGLPGTNQNAPGWGYVGGWDLRSGVSTVSCDGAITYGGGGEPTISNQLPRVAFLAKYVGGGIAYRIGNYMFADEGFMVGDATWAQAASNFKGPGTLNTERSVWSGTTLLTDYVFDLYYDGVAKPEDAVGASQYVRTPLKELPNYVERERRLPNVDGRDEWNKSGIFSVDKLGNQLWVTVEDQALYIQELNARMDALKQFLVEKKLKELEGDQ